MFGVDEVLLSWLVLPLAKRLSDDVVDGAYQWLKAQGVTFGAHLVQKIEGRTATPESIDFSLQGTSFRSTGQCVVVILG